MALHSGADVLFCAARVRMLGTERFAEMRERLASGAARGVVVSAGLLYAQALDWVPAGVSATSDDNINYKGLVAEPSLQNDFSHPICKIAGVDGVSALSAALPPTRK